MDSKHLQIKQSYNTTNYLRNTLHIQFDLNLLQKLHVQVHLFGPIKDAELSPQAKNYNLMNSYVAYPLKLYILIYSFKLAKDTELFPKSTRYILDQYICTQLML